MCLLENINIALSLHVIMVGVVLFIVSYALYKMLVPNEPMVKRPKSFSRTQDEISKRGMTKSGTSISFEKTKALSQQESSRNISSSSANNGAILDSLDWSFPSIMNDDKQQHSNVGLHHHSSSHDSSSYDSSDTDSDSSSSSD